MAQASFEPGASRSRVLRSAAAPQWLGTQLHRVEALQRGTVCNVYRYGHCVPRVIELTSSVWLKCEHGIAKLVLAFRQRAPPSPETSGAARANAGRNRVADDVNDM